VLTLNVIDDVVMAVGTVPFIVQSGNLGVVSGTVDDPVATFAAKSRTATDISHIT
jgi:hypothetical protein